MSDTSAYTNIHRWFQYISSKPEVSRVSSKTAAEEVSEGVWLRVWPCCMPFPPAGCVQQDGSGGRGEVCGAARGGDGEGCGAIPSRGLRVGVDIHVTVM